MHRQLCCRPHLIRIGQLVEISHGALGVGCSLHDGPRIVLQHLDPACNIAGMVRTRLDAKPKIGRKERACACL